MQQWTQDEAIAYECACEAITHLRAILTGEIAKESRKSHPDEQRLKDLYAERSQLFRERAELHVTDQAKISRIRADYGARIRSWIAEHQAVAA